MSQRAFIQRLDRRWYPKYGANWDDELFRERILARVSRDSRVLDLGAGAGIVPHMNFKGLVAQVCGVDVDPRVTSNPYLDSARVGSGEGIPFGNDEFDVVFADNVLEHLSHPSAVFAEVCRVLRPGGWFLAKTPNRAHYMPTISRCTPVSFHRFYNRLRGRATVDTFGTFYRANSRSTVQRLAADAGLGVTALSLVEGRPEYLRITVPTYALGMVYERLVNSLDRLACLRILLIAEMQKPSQSQSGSQ